MEVKAANGREKSLRMLIYNKKFVDIYYGIKFAGRNLRYGDNIYIFPFICAFFLKRYFENINRLEERHGH